MIRIQRLASALATSRSHMVRVSTVIVLLSGASCLLFALTVHAAEAWPTRPVRIVLPAPAGGGIDAVARVTSNRLGTALSQQVIVDNRPGARGVIGVEIVSKAAADGYTLLV